MNSGRACKVEDDPNEGGSLTVIKIGSILNQRFLLEKELGRGGMGAVYLANDEVLQRKVAIKLLKEQSGAEVGKKLKLEAQIAARLLHDYVVRIYDFGLTESTYYLVMEEVQGSSYSKRWRHLALTERLRILAQVAEALDYAHHQGVIHRDVKPANVLVTGNDVPKLSDFGLSTIAEQGDQTGVVRGTPHYMSPEQTRGGRLDYRTDLYSLGVMIYEAATGTQPFSGTSISIMSKHFSVEPEPPRTRNQHVSVELDGLIRSLLAKKPEARPGSGAIVAQALLEEIERIRGRDTRGTEAPSVTAGTRTIGVTTVAATDSVAPSSSQVGNGPVTAPNPSVTVSGTVSKSPSSDSVRASLATPASSSAQPSGSLAIASVGSTGGVMALIRSPLVRRMLGVVLAEPIALSPEERYLHGHYLAYLLSGSRRQGLFLRRPLEPRNADRGRLLLGLTYAIIAGGGEEAVRDAAALLDERIDVRPILSPIVVAKYLSFRESPAKRKLFRQTRKALGEASKYAQKRMIDAKGVLNPGLMPQRLDDLNLLAPPRDDVDDVLVERWNRVTDVWRNEVEFRTSVLRYATTKAYRDPASAALWPEVVYPLIERARWHRRIRSRTEAVWNYLRGHLRVPDAGVAFDRVLHRSIPAPLYADLENELRLFPDSPGLDNLDSDPFSPGLRDQADRLAASLTTDRTDLAHLAAELVEPEKDKSLLQLTDPDPLRFSQGQLHDLWKEALSVLQSQAPLRPGFKPSGHRHVPVGPYRLIVIPSIRGRSAGQIAIQGMTNKQIELLTPTVRTKGSSSKPLVAVWVYEDNSLAIAHLDFMNSEKFVIWHAPRGHQLNFDDAADFNHELYALGMEIPDQLNKVLTRHFKPSTR
jgi:eukaryotic-like serine/threonine-protein kinase